MKTNLNFINVIDLECCCWKGKPAGDIIEIGIAVVSNDSGKLVKNETIIVNPQDEVSEFCTELTTLKPEFVKQYGISFRDACTKLETDFNSRNHLWVSYGDFDRLHMMRMCGKHMTQYPFGRSHLNIKNMIAVLEQWPKEIGMAGAYNKLLQIPITGVHHRGIDDARNIATILITLLNKYRKNVDVC